MQLVEPTAGEPTSTNPDRAKLTKKIFTTLEAAIGTRLAQLWEGTNRTAVAELWTRALVDFTVDDCAAACNSFIDSGDDWPPGLPRFKAMCAVAQQRRKAEEARGRQGQLALTSHNSAEAQALVEEARANFMKLRPAGINAYWALTAVKNHESGAARLSPDAYKIAKEAVARASVRGDFDKPVDRADGSGSGAGAVAP